MGSLERNVEWGIKILRDMISIPTVNPPGEKYGEFARFSREVLEPLGFRVNVVEVPRNYVERHHPDYAQYPRYIILARYGEGRPVLHFNGHYDVVPPGSGWTRDPFNPVMEGGRVYGRGSSDMKGGIAAFLTAAKTAVESGRRLKGSIEVALVPDEEIGGMTGSGYLVREVGARPDYAVIGEPSGSGIIWVGHKGAVWILVEVFGKQAHGSTPWFGVNAFEHMVDVAQRFMREYAPSLEARRSPYEYDDPRGARPTVMIGGEVRGGAKVNVVPGYYAFSVDRRVVPEERIEDVKKEIAEFVEKISRELEGRGVKVSLRVTNELMPALTDPNSEFVRTLKAVAEEVLRVGVKTTVCLGGLDMRYYTEVGVPTVTYGPGLLGLAHMADEYVPVEELEKTSHVYYSLIERLLL